MQAGIRTRGAVGGLSNKPEKQIRPVKKTDGAIDILSSLDIERRIKYIFFPA